MYVAVPVARFQSSFNGGKPVMSTNEETAEPPQTEDAKEDRQEEQVDKILNSSSNTKTNAADNTTAAAAAAAGDHDDDKDHHTEALESFIHSFPETMRARVHTVLHCMKQNHLKFRPNTGEMVDAHDKLIQHSNMKSIIHSILSAGADDSVLTSPADLRGRGVVMQALAHAHINPFVLFPNTHTRQEYEKIRDMLSTTTTKHT